ncbi:phenylalanine 4-monooxygenase [Micavibrio aeruginosavorus]|uniref:phenylalanine 4-monooxygenase n=1 Tax=Micavibrio aeruginosavorus EPB TaxID=349215 RepID=M4VF44_9BACT|nr:phenylalanine 4-monooxygenase [Micavibrio aeruginosavorus]AGH97105.1 Phenylalanine-4-hydroxylase [Micavibrio aeruginosavorus EPB]
MTESDSGNPLGAGVAADAMKYVIDQGWDNYTDEEHETWRLLYERQRTLMPGRACKEFLQNMDALGIGDQQIPRFTELNKKLKALTGWEIVAVEGLIPDAPFFQLLADRKFPAGSFIRRRDQMDYLEEPDVFHDVFGHAPMLAHPVFADYIQAYGQGGLRAMNDGVITNLTRLYWYTVEFGLMKTDEGLRIYGAGILSSPGETVFAADSDSPNKIGFNLKRVMQTKYKIDDFQTSYFVIDSFDDLFKQTYQDFGPIYADLKANPMKYAPGDLLPDDVILQRGTGVYAAEAAKRKAQAHG